jgi:predicted lysophospholipase L1 biosynthesis ABC-type transport system permease subunit
MKKFKFTVLTLLLLLVSIALFGFTNSSSVTENEKVKSPEMFFVNVQTTANSSGQNTLQEYYDEYAIFFL